MFGRIGVMEMLLPAAFLYITMWNIPPIRIGLVCFGATVAAIRNF